MVDHDTIQAVVAHRWLGTCLQLDGQIEEAAARLFGAAEVLSEMTSDLDPDERYVTDRSIATLRERLDPAPLEVRWAEGRALDWQQAVEEALMTQGSLAT